MLSTAAMPSTTAVEGQSSGSLMRSSMVQNRAPSMLAASITSVGRARRPPKKTRKVKPLQAHSAAPMMA